MAPTPITTAWQAASSSRGTMSRWRRSRSRRLSETRLMQVPSSHGFVEDTVELLVPRLQVPPVTVRMDRTIGVELPCVDQLRDGLNVRRILLPPLLDPGVEAAR